MILLRFFVFLLAPSYLLISVERADAYPGYIGFGYTSCGTCHYNAFGNGPLNDYGRGIAAVAIAAKPIPGISDDTLSEYSGFLGKQPMPDWLRVQANYRGLYYKTARGERWIHMAARGVVVLQSPDRRYFAVGDFGYVPTPARKAATNQKADNWISREHYVGAQITETMRIQAGLTDVVYGLRTPEHIAFARSRTLMAQNDQTHGVSLHYAKEPFEAGAHLFAGNLLQDSKLRLMGGSAQGEYTLSELVRVGGSTYFAKNDFRLRQMNAAHLRVGIPEGHSLITEVGTIFDDPKGQKGSLGAYVFLQSMTRLVRGVHLLMNFETYSRSAMQSDGWLMRYGPAIQYHPMQRLSFRGDFQVNKTLGTSIGSKDQYDWLFQVHLWL